VKSPDFTAKETKVNRQMIWKTVAIAAVMVVAGGALALGGSTPWKDKPYENWSQKDINLILQDSPWGKIVPYVGGTMHQLGNNNLDEADGSVGSGGTAQGGAGSGKTYGGGGGGFSAILPAEHDTVLNDPRKPKTYYVLWWSARTVREAEARQAMLAGQATEEQMKQWVSSTTADYEVMIRGLDMSVFDGRPAQSFMDKAFLQLKSSKQKIMPTRVEYLKTQEGHVSAAIFHFAMKNSDGEPIVSPADNHVDFYCHVADGTIRTWFEPAEMVDPQGLDL
jgi:hypothetical protein